MTSRLFTAVFFTGLVTLFSCAGNDNKDYIDESLVSPSTGNKATQNADTTLPVAQPVLTQPVSPLVNTATPQTVPVNLGTNVMPVSNNSAPPVTTNTQTTAPGMNPPHGQPGHRCDIAVGAPLNSPPAQTNPTSTTINTTPAVTTTAPGMNPPHGQPGHRCDIAVGAPLNSPVSPNVIPAQPNVAPVNNAPGTSKPDSSNSY